MEDQNNEDSLLALPCADRIGGCRSHAACISASATSAVWLLARIFIPGQVLAALVFPHTAESAASPLRFFVEFALNFAVTWIGLLFVVVFLDRLCGTLYELTKN
jgi:hypothetical protein